MTFGLLPEEDAVDVRLGDFESVTVPADRVWSVTLIFSDPDSENYVEIDGERVMTYDDLQDDDQYEHSVKLTVHAGSEIYVNMFNNNEICWIVGWEFEYWEEEA